MSEIGFEVVTWFKLLLICGDCVNIISAMGEGTVVSSDWKAPAWNVNYSVCSLIVIVKRIIIAFICLTIHFFFHVQYTDVPA